MSMTRASVDLAFRQYVVGIGEGNVRSALRETALNRLQEIDRTNLSQNWRDPAQQLCGLFFGNDYGRASSSALKLIDPREIFMRRLGPSLLSDVKRTATGVEYSETFTQIRGLCQYVEARNTCQRQPRDHAQSLRHGQSGTHARE